MKRVVVIGLGRFGSMLAQSLAEANVEVIAIDQRRELVEAVADIVAHAVILDATDEKALLAQGVATVDVAVVTIGEDFEANVLATIACKNFGIPQVIARGATRNQCKILERIGADIVIQPEEEAARRLGRRILSPTIRESQELAEGVSVVQMEAPAVFFNRKIADIDLRRRYGANLVAIKRPERDPAGEVAERVIFPRADTAILAKDVLVLVGSDEDLQVLVAEQEAA